MRISDWSSDVCSSDLIRHYLHGGRLDLDPRTRGRPFRALVAGGGTGDAAVMLAQHLANAGATDAEVVYLDMSSASRRIAEARAGERRLTGMRSEEHTSELQSLMRISYAVLRLNKNRHEQQQNST